MSQRRQYSNQLETQPADMGLGFNWIVNTWPYLVQIAGASISFVQGTRNALWFDPVGDGYTARYGGLSVLEHDSAAGEFVLTRSDGTVYRFRDFGGGSASSSSSSGVPPVQKLPGRLISITDPGAQVTEVVSVNASGRIETIQQQATLDGVLQVSQLHYTFNLQGRITSVLSRRRSDGNPWQDIRRASYEYYAGGSAHGSDGDLMRVRIEEPSGTIWTTIDQSYYRYYTQGEANGFIHGLKFVVESDGYAEMLADGLDPTAVSGAVLMQYTKYYFQYNADRRVTQEIVDRVSRIFSFAYTTSAHLEGYNRWKRKTVETRPDGTTNTVYTNYIGQVLIRDFSSGSDHWIDARAYSESSGADQGKLIQHAQPSAVIGYSESAADLDVALRSNQGLIELTSYYASTGSGGVAGYQESRSLQHGTSGTPVPQSYTQYTSRSAGGPTIYPTSKQTVYREVGGGSPIETAMDYTWHAGTVQIEQLITTLPIAPQTQNGSGSADTQKSVFDVFGNLQWQMDASGFVIYRQFDIPTGAVIEQIDDADTSLLSGVPSGWSTPSGGGRHLVSHFEIDSRGRNIQSLGPVHTIDIGGVATPVRRATWTVYDDAAHQTRAASGYADVSGSSPVFHLINPVSIRQEDPRGNVTEQIQAIRPSTSGKLQPGDTFSQSSYTRLTTHQYTGCCLLSSVRVYHSIPTAGPGLSGDNYDQTTYGYDSMRRRNRQVSPGGTITLTTFDSRGQTTGMFIGTNDNGATDSDPTGGGATGNNMVQIESLIYDGGNDGGDGNLTRTLDFVDALNTRATDFVYDWRNRQTDIHGELDRFTRRTYDNLNQVIRVDGHDTSASGNLISRRETRFDNRRRAYQSIRYAVDPNTGTVGNSLTDNTWFDAVGNPVKTLPAGAGESFTKRTFNGVGWNTATYTGFGDDSSYADVFTVAGDVILQQVETAQDDAGNVIQTTRRDRYHSAPASQTGALGSPSLAPNARVTYIATYPDPIGRTIAGADYGTAGGAGFTRSAIIPASSDTALVPRQAFSPAGDLQDSTDPAGKVTRVNHDDAGRTVETIKNYVASPGMPSSSTACSPSDDVNQTVLTTYTPDGEIHTITAVNAETGDQVTQYVHGTTLASSGIATSHLLSQEIYPDSTGPSDRITHTYNRQSENASHTDQNGTVDQFDRDALARPTQDRVTTLGVGVDGSVRRIERAYDVRSNNVRITSFDNPTVGSGSVVNEVTFEFDDFDQPIDSGQAHEGVVIPGTTPSVATSYADGGDNTIRPTSITYPNGRTITRNYGAAGSITNKMNQVLSLVDDDSTVLAAYERLGLSTFVQQTSPQPDLRYTLISPTLSIDPTTGDIYSGLDRFGRVKDVRWRDVSAGTDLSRIKYGYDRASNRTWRENPSDPNREHDWLYAYDGLHRLSSAARGQLNSGHTAITNDQFNQCWSLDPTGNWKGFQQDDNADGTADLIQIRTANAVNEITDITNTTGAAWATPTYDPNGNSLVQPRPDLGPGASMTGVYDAWNRMVKVLDSDTLDVLLENQFDGRNFRIVAKEYASGILARTRDYYFTGAWQCVEEHVDTSNTPRRQYVWGIRYIDDLVLRDRDISPSGGLLGERLYYLADANWNTTAVVSDSGNVQERYEYTPYGNLSVLEANFMPKAISSYSVHYTYTSREWTPTAGLYYFRNRWYDALLGRFSSRDPIGYEGSPRSLYEYTLSSPLNYLDPSGLQYTYTPGSGMPPVGPWPPRPRPRPTIIPVHPGIPGPYNQPHGGEGGAGDGIYEFFAELLPCGSISFSYSFSITTAGGAPVPQFVLDVLNKYGVPALPPPGGGGTGTSPCPPCTRCCIDSVTTTNFTMSVTAYYLTSRFTPNIPISANASTTTVVSTGSCVDIIDPCPPVVNTTINLPPLVIDTGIDVAQL